MIKFLYSYFICEIVTFAPFLSFFFNRKISGMLINYFRNHRRPKPVPFFCGKVRCHCFFGICNSWAIIINTYDYIVIITTYFYVNISLKIRLFLLCSSNDSSEFLELIKLYLIDLHLHINLSLYSSLIEL